MRFSIPARRLALACSLVALLGATSAWARAQAVGGTNESTDTPKREGTEAALGETIKQVRVEGNRRVEVEAVKRALKNREGQPFDASKTADDLRGLWGLRYFADIQLLVQHLPQGGIAYVVRVQERPSVREVKLQGNEELSKDDLKDSIDLRSYSILDMDAVRRNAKKIQEKYVEKGFFLAEVTPKLESVEGGQEVDVVFVIREHSKVMVKEIQFIGVEKLKVDDLKSAMATKEGGFFSFLTSEGTYREEMFQRDLAVIQAAYYDQGFINVKVEKPWISISSDKRFIYITLKIEEGEQYRIGKLDVSGELLVPKQEFLDKMEAEPGQLFNRSALSKDILSITDIYYDQGYAYANITPVNKINPEERTIDLTFDIQKGKQVSIERIDVIGNTKTRDKVIRREVRVYEGELFSGSGIRRSKERVTALGYFETVEVSHKPGSDDSKVIVQVEVKEKSTGTFNVGLGFSNVANFIFTAQISQQNFFGWGQSVSLSAQLSSIQTTVQASFYDPHFLDSNFIFALNLYRIQLDRYDYDRISTGGDVTVGYPIIEDLAAQLTYTQEHINVRANSRFQSYAIRNLLQNGITSSLRLSLTYDKRNNRLFPSQGFMHYGSVELAPPFLGSTFEFLRYSAYSRLYFPLFWGIVFKTNTTIGYIQQLNPQKGVPFSERYKIGGINTIRGYYPFSISPVIDVHANYDMDAVVIPNFGIGGDKQLIFNFELEFPILEKVGIRGVVFYDAGNAYDVGEKFFQSNQYKLPLGLFHSVGWGFRWFSPLGPLRFEWGVPLNRRPQDQAVQFEFTIGNFF